MYGSEPVDDKKSFIEKNLLFSIVSILLSNLLFLTSLIVSLVAAGLMETNKYISRHFSFILKNFIY